MPEVTNVLLERYVEEIKKIYGEQLKSVILYGSYARGDFKADSDIDVMILVDLSDIEIEKYGEQLSCSTYDFNEFMLKSASGIARRKLAGVSRLNSGDPSQSK